MTYQQVLEQIESGEIIASALNWYGEEAVRLIKLAVEKQIPKKPIPQKVEGVPVQIGNGRFLDGTTYFLCPVCKTHLTRSPKYCWECGQALDWEDGDGP